MCHCARLQQPYKPQPKINNPYIYTRCQAYHRSRKRNPRVHNLRDLNPGLLCPLRSSSPVHNTVSFQINTLPTQCNHFNNSVWVAQCIIIPEAKILFLYPKFSESRPVLTHPFTPEINANNSMHLTQTQPIRITYTCIVDSGTLSVTPFIHFETSSH